MTRRATLGVWTCGRLRSMHMTKRSACYLSLISYIFHLGAIGGTAERGQAMVRWRIASAVVLVAAMTSALGYGQEQTKSSITPICTGLRELFGDDLVACSEPQFSLGTDEAPPTAKPLTAGIRVNKEVPFKNSVPNLLQLYRYNTGIRAKTAVAEWASVFPSQILPNFSEVASATGCNGDVCIYVKGEGRVVDEWWTSAWQYYGDGRICPDVYWTVEYDPSVAYGYNYDAYFNSNGPCATVPDPESRVFWYGYSQDVPHVFRNQSILCNRWRETDDPLSGYPCIQVHT